jgi:hypothetical protein
MTLLQGCQIFRGKTYQNGKIDQITIKYTKWPQHIPKRHTIYQHLAIKGPPKLTQTGILVTKYTIWQPCAALAFVALIFRRTPLKFCAKKGD